MDLMEIDTDKKKQDTSWPKTMEIPLSMNINDEITSLYYDLDPTRNLDLKSLEIPNESERLKYISNSTTAKKHNCARLCLAVSDQSVYFEKYEWTLEEYIKRNDFEKRCWYKSNDMLRMKSTFQQLIRKIIQKTSMMVKTKQKFRLNLKTVVLSSGLEPQFIPLQSSSGNAYYLWTMLSKILSDIENEIKSRPGGEKLHPEVVQFRKLFMECIEKNRSDCELLASHPALLTEQERIHFVSKIRYMFKRGKGYVQNYNDRKGNFEGDGYAGWSATVTNAPSLAGLKGNLKKSIDKFRKGHPKLEPHVQYVCFIHNCYEHLDLKTDKGGDYSIKKLIKDFDVIYPEHASYVFKRYVFGNTRQEFDVPTIFRYDIY